MSLVPTPIHATLIEAHPTNRTLDDIAESLLVRLAAESTTGHSVAITDLTDQQAVRLFRPLLACLARKSAQESGTEFNPYGGTLAFVRPRTAHVVRLAGTFNNRPGAVQLAFQVPELWHAPHAVTARGSTNTLVELLSPAVVDYWIDESGFALASDLARLDRVRIAGAAESAVLYCNRIVEAMARHAVGPSLTTQTPSLAGLISELDKYHRLPGPLKRLLHLLRSLGNDARHAIQPVSTAEGDVAFVILLRWLEWAFCEAASGPQLHAITLPNRPTDLLLPQGLSRLVDDAAATGEAILAELSSRQPGEGGMHFNPLLLAAAAEALISRNRIDHAKIVLDAGILRSPHDRRLRQLVGLYWSRRGGAERNIEYLQQARQELEPLLPKGGGLATDEETFGILGGVFKRLFEFEPSSPDHWLEKSRDTYRAGWEQSGRTNSYLGINAATAALWLGSGEHADLAVHIRNGLSALDARLRTAIGGRALNYWDQVTWAEAELLLGDWDRAGELYRDAFGRFASLAGDIAVAVKQARRILDRLGQSTRAGDILGAWGN